MRDTCQECTWRTICGAFKTPFYPKICGERRDGRHAYLQDTLVVMRGQRITGELQFDAATAAWAKDRIWHPSRQTTPLKNGQLLMTLQVADTRELLGWI